MVNKKVFEMYKNVISKDVIEKGDLNKLGISDSEIDELVSSGYLRKDENNLYYLNSIDSLYDFTNYLIDIKDYHMLDSCYEKLFELSKGEYKDVLLYRLIFNSLFLNDNYAKAFTYIEKLLATNNKYYCADAKFYLFALSFVTEIPDKIKKYLPSSIYYMKTDSSDSRYQNNNLINRAKEKIYNGEIFAAHDKIGKFFYNDYDELLNNIMGKLIIILSEYEYSFFAEFLKYCDNKDYDGALDYISKYKSTEMGNKIIKMLNYIKKLQNGEPIPKKWDKFNPKYVGDAIIANDFELVLKMINEKSQTRKKNIDDIVIEKLAKEILILKKHNDSLNNNPKIIFEKFLICLNKKEYDLSFDFLSKFLELINASKYQFYVMDLLKINIAEGDTSYTNAINCCMCIFLENGNISIDVPTYVNCFYKELENKKFDVANLYLDIIINTCKLNNDSTLADHLCEVFESFVKKYNNEKDNNVVITDSDKNYVNEQYKKLLKDKGILLIGPFDDERIRVISTIIKDQYEDMDVIPIGFGNEKQLVLRYINKNTKFSLEKFNIGKAAYYAWEHKKCIDIYKELINCDDFIFRDSQMFLSIGKLYFEIGNKQKAIDYLTVAEYLFKKENLPFLLTDLLSQLKQEVASEKADSNVKIDDSINDLGINTFNDTLEINNFKNALEETNSKFYSNKKDFLKRINRVMKTNLILLHIANTGLDVESACKELGIDLEKANLVKLICAREYFIHGLYEKGDQFLVSYRKGNGKTDKTEKFYKEILERRRDYLNEKKRKSVVLRLNIKPDTYYKK